MQLSRNQFLGLLFIIFASSLFLSPKWFTAVAVWVHFPALLLLTREGGKRWWLASYVVMVAASVIGQLGVFPMPIGSLLFFMVLANLFNLIPLLADRFVHKRVPGWASTLVFPVVATLLDVFAANGPQGTWGNAAYTQFHFRPLMQLAAVTGIFGINFLYYWFASSVVTLLSGAKSWKPILPWGLTFVVVMVFGGLRLAAPSSDGKATSLAAIHLSNDGVYETMYTAAFDSVIRMPEEMNFTDEVLEELNRGMTAFMADAEGEQFRSVHARIDSMQAAYFTASREAARGGAKLISWSEAAILTTKEREAELQERAAHFADEENIYLLYPTAVFHAEKVGVADVFIENKVLTFGPEGQLLNEYFKNIPVMGVEPSFPGDGVVPAIPTTFGNISPLICYDADHPQLVDQTSTNGTALMVVPTGDWDAIAPFHTYMAAVRCIENGVGMLKATNHGLSAIIDNRGNIVTSATLDSDQQVLVGELPLETVPTPYTTTAMIFVVGLQLLFLAGLLLLVYRGILALRKRWIARQLSPA